MKHEREYAVGEVIDGCEVTEAKSDIDCDNCKYIGQQCTDKMCMVDERSDGLSVVFRRFVPIVLLLLTLSVSAQIDWRNTAIRSSLLFTSGFCDGTSEVLKIKYDAFKRVFPNCNDQFWDYKISHINKYNSKMPLATTSFVWTTDGYHLTRMMRNCTMITAITIPIGKGKNWKCYVAEALIGYCSYTAGFNCAYEIVFKK